MREDKSQKRPIRSYLMRRGRMTQGQRQAIEDHWSRFGLNEADGYIDLQQVFDRDAPTVLQIGFGMGKALLEMATVQPEVNYIGVDVHRPGVGAVLAGLIKQSLSNVRVYQVDVNDVLEQCIPDNSLAGVNIFFPDPWPKQRHQKRRLIRKPFLKLLHDKLELDGTVHMATDWQDYAEEMLQVASQSPGLYNKFGEKAYAPDRQGRPETKFEHRGEQLGHSVWDLVLVKRGP